MTIQALIAYPVTAIAVVNTLVPKESHWKGRIRLALLVGFALLSASLLLAAWDFLRVQRGMGNSRVWFAILMGGVCAGIARMQLTAMKMDGNWPFSTPSVDQSRRN